MNDYYEVRVGIDPCCEDATDFLAALLADIGYESFVPDQKGLTAYVKAEEFSSDALNGILSDDFPFPAKISVNYKLIPGQDWNSEWEKNYFKPIVVGDCVIHSSFHTDFPSKCYDIVIDPKMAFGTGHHSTTSLIIEALLNIDLKDKTVIDMGTGTGILAILSAMRGASPVYGIEIDSFAYENAVDNVRINKHSEINVINGDASALQQLPSADVLIANINRNIILADIEAYSQRLKSGGTMLLSGFYTSDADIILKAAAPLHLVKKEMHSKGDNWCMLMLTKTIS